MFNEFEIKLTEESNWELKYVHIFKGIFIAASENEYKKGNRIQIYEENAEFSIDEKHADDLNFFVLTIKTKKHKVMIRSISRISLEYIIFHAIQKDQKDVGRPLTFYPHLSNIESPLEQARLNENNYRGFLNLIIVALVISHLRLMWENYTKYGILITPRNIIDFVLRDDNFLFLFGSLIIACLSIYFTYFLEIIASRLKFALNYPHFINILHSVNLLALLAIPLGFHKYKLINPITGVYVLTVITVVFLKLFSYIHFWYDVRMFKKKKSDLIKTDSKIKNIQSELYKDIEEVIDNYPKNVLFIDLLAFLVLPVLCFQYKYPRTQRIRKFFVFKYLSEFLICILAIFFISWQYMLPIVTNSMKFMDKDDYFNLIERILKLAIPNVYVWILMFFAFFHSWLNLLAELNRFADRTFYKDWWNSLYLDEYWRTWNLPTHYWLIRHIYNPLRRRNIGKLTASGVVFFVSAVFHEYIISGALGYLNYWAFLAMFLNFPVSIFQEMIKGIKANFIFIFRELINSLRC